MNDDDEARPPGDGAELAVDGDGVGDAELARVLEGYLAEVEAGRALDPERLMAQHPAIADRLRACLASLHLVERAAGALAIPEPQPPADGHDAGRRLGDFRILREVGRGGMGVVYEAEQVSLGRRVALKVLPFAAAIDPKHLQRFELEAHAAATLHHTNIVPVYSVGSERGEHYYAMQFIDGRNLAEVIRELRQIDGLEAREPSRADVDVDDFVHAMATELVSGQLAPAGADQPPTDDQPRGDDAVALATPPAAPGSKSGSSIRDRAFFRTVAGLGVQVAEALEHAHGQGVLHRDIKPSNLLLDARGNLWVTDFGLARFQQDNGLTMTGDLLGTLRYMSPEQATARRVVVDQRTDIYSLGVTLYELLTLHPAFSGRDRVEILRRITEQEPRPLRQLNPAVPADLETIVLKAMEKDPAARYATAAAMADDLRRFLESRPIVARRPSLLDRATKWMLRHRTATAATAVVVATVLISMAVAAVMVASKERERGQAALALERERRQAAVAVGAIESRTRKEAEERAEEGQRRQVRLNIEQGTRLMNDDDMAGSLRYFVEALRLDNGDPARVEAHRVRIGMLLDRCAKPARIWFHDHPIDAVAFRPDGGALAVTLRDGTVTVSDADTGRPLGPVLKQCHELRGLDFSPDGRRLAVTSRDRTVRVREVASGRETVPPLGHPELIQGVQFSPDGTLLLTTLSRQWRVWDAGTGRPVTDWISSEQAGTEARFSPDSRLVAASFKNRGLRVYEARTGHPVTSPLHHEHLVKLATRHSFSPDARRIVAGGLDSTVRIWDTTTGALAVPPIKHTQWVSASFSPDGRRVLSWCNDGSARIWDAATGAPSCESMRHPGVVEGAEFSADGTLVATRCDDHAVRVWNAATGRPLVPPLWHLGPVSTMHFHPDGRSLFTASDRAVRRWDLAGAGPAGPRLPSVEAVYNAPFSGDGRLVITHGMGGTAVWDAATGSRSGPPVIVAANWLPEGEISPDGRSFAALGRQTNLKWAAWVWDLESRRVKAGPLVLEYDKEAGKSPTSVITWSPDSRRLAVAAGSGQFNGPATTVVRVWDVQTAEPVTPVLSYDYPVFSLEFSPDGRSVLTSGQYVRILDAESGTLRVDPIKLGCSIARYSPDGRRFLTVSANDVRVWDAATGGPLSPPIQHPVAVKAAFFTRDGGRVVTASDSIRVWDAAQGTPAGTPMRFLLPIDDLTLSPDGRHLLVTCGWEGINAIDPGFAQVVDLATGWPVSPPLWRERFIQDARFSPDGRRVATACWKGGTLLWNLLPDERPLEDLVRVTEVLSGTRLDVSGTSVPITREELRGAYEALVTKDPETFHASRAQVLGWHHQQLAVCEAAGQWDAALAHLDRVIELGPKVDALDARRIALVSKIAPQGMVTADRRVALKPVEAAVKGDLAAPATIALGLTPDAEVRARFANNLAKLARPDEAVAATREAIVLHAELLIQRPTDKAWLIEQARSSSKLAGTLGDRGQRDEALDCARRALDLLDMTQGANGFERARILYELAQFAHVRSTPAEADALFNRAIAEFRNYFAGDAKPERQRGHYAWNLTSLTMRGNFSSRYPDEAEKLWDEALTLWRAIYAPSSSRRDDLVGFVRTLSAQSHHLRKLATGETGNKDTALAAGRVARAEALFQEAIARQRQLVAGFADTKDRSDLVQMLLEESEYLLGPTGQAGATSGTPLPEDAAARRRQAEALLAEAIPLGRQLVAEFPDEAAHRDRLAALLRVQGQHFGPAQKD